MISMMDIKRLTDEELIEEYANGNAESFEEVIDRYLKPLYNFAYKMCGNEEDSEEIVQDTFLKAWKNLKKFKAGFKFKTWIYTIARNSAIDFLRKKRSISFSQIENGNEDFSFGDTIKDEEILADELFEKKENIEKIRQLIEEMSITYKEVLLLHYHEGMNLEETAGILDKPLNTVKSLHRRGLVILKEKLTATKYVL